MRNLPILAALTTVMFGATVPAGAAPSSASAKSNNASAIALADCQRLREQSGLVGWPSSAEIF